MVPRELHKWSGNFDLVRFDFESSFQVQGVGNPQSPPQMDKLSYCANHKLVTYKYQ